MGDWSTRRTSHFGTCGFPDAEVARLRLCAPGRRPSERRERAHVRSERGFAGRRTASDRCLTGQPASPRYPGGSTGWPGRGWVRVGVAHHFAAALVLPYRVFHAAAEETRYDIERLTDRFGVGYETLCHRLSTLQRPRLRGVPFSFVRVDRAGNMSKRQSATGFHFSRAGGTCPLWNVYEAFAAPGRIHVQVAVMPDGQRYLWTARTVTRHRGGWGEPGKTFAIGLGCELRHASRLVYSDGLDLANKAAATPIGMGCRVRERLDCPQRATPPLGRTFAVDENASSFVPYAVDDSRTG